MLPITVGFTAWVLHRQFGGLSLQQLQLAVAAQPVSHLSGALALTALSFVALALYDVFGLHTVARRRVGLSVGLLAGATANAISNTVGFHAITGSLVRTRIYLLHGLTRTEVVRIVSLSWLALGLGFIAMLTLAELVEWLTSAGGARSLLIAAALTAGLSIVVFRLRGADRQLRLFGWTQPLPSARAALILMAIGTIESAAAIGALYVLLPPDLAPAFSTFAVGCIAAVALGIVAHVPGGIGVFEASVTALLAGAGRADLLGALLLYRAVYNILPFVLSVAILGLLGYLGAGRVSSTAGSGQ